MRPPAETFPRRVTITPRPTRTGDGILQGAPRTVAASFDSKLTVVADERDGTTPGEVTATGLLLTFVEGYAAPGSTVTLHEGTPAARTVTVVAAALFDDPRGPEHAEMWTV